MNNTNYNFSSGKHLPPPYPPSTKSIGSPASKPVDVIASAVFVALWATATFLHLAIVVTNRRHAHKPLFSMALAVFSTIRVSSVALRIAWAEDSRNVRLAIAAQALTSAGTVVLYVVNIFLAQRLMRVRHPHVGWHRRYMTFMPRLAVGTTLIFFVILIVSSLLPSFTLDPHGLTIEHNLQLTSLVWMLLAAVLPIVSISGMAFIGRPSQADRLGLGSFRVKSSIVLTSAFILCFSASWRLGAAAARPISMSAPSPWYLTKAAYYVVDQGLEFVVVFAFAVLRIDRRFCELNDACHEGAYAVELLEDKPSKTDEKAVRFRPLDRTVLDGNGRTVTGRKGRQLTYFERRVLATQRMDSSTGSVSPPSPSTVLEYDVKTGHFGLKSVDSDGHSIRTATRRDLRQ